MRKKNGNRYLWGMFSLLALLVLCCLPVSAGVQEGAGEYEIYPTPHEAVYGEQQMTLTKEVGVIVGENIDSYTLKRIDETLEVLDMTKTTGTVQGKTNLIVGVYGSGDAADTYAKANGAEASLFGKHDAYMLYVKGNEIVVVGKNADAAFYGVTTVKRIFQQITDMKITEMTIEDYSDTEFRGFIEGYYGEPWSVEDRIELMKFGGEIKMNQYIFAPKDDPYHNSKWRELYPESELENIQKMAQAGNESKCFFVWSIHCFMNSAFRFNTEANYQSDLGIVKAKFGQLLEAGVRQFGVLADDAAAVSPENTVKLLNDLNDWIAEQQQTYPDLRSDILYCPNDYMGSGGSEQLKNINKVNRNVHIMATGGKIWGEVTPSFGTNFYNNIATDGNEGRYPYMWVNWPCTDNSKNHLIMGGQSTFLHAGVQPGTYEGIVLNPMQQSEPSKVAIFMNGDFAWNCWESEEEGNQSWEDSFKYVDHVSAVESDTSDALREMSKHMINQAMDGRVTALEESVELSPKLNEFWAAVQAGTDIQAAIDKIRPEFEKLNAAAKLYLEEGKNRRLAAISTQGQPFFQCMRDLSQTNLDLLDALEDILNGDDNGVWEGFSKAQADYEASQSYSYRYVDHTEYAEVGNQYIVPFTDKVMKYVSDSVQQILDPEHINLEKTLIYEVGGSSSTNNLSGALSNATDGNLATTVEIQRQQVVGDYVGMTFNKAVSVSNIRVALWSPSAVKNFFYAGKMQYTTDGKTWVDFADELQPQGTGEAVQTVEMEFDAMDMRGFRWVCTDLGGQDRWLLIRDIGYNIGAEEVSEEEKYEGTFSYTEGWSVYGTNPVTNATDGNDSTMVWFDPSTTVKDNSLVGDYIQLDLGSEKQVGRVRALIGSDNGDKWKKYHAEYSADGTNWEKTSSYTGADTGTDTYEVNLNGVTARYIRIVNDQQVGVWVKFSEFSVFSYVEGLDDMDMEFTNTENVGWKVNLGEDVFSVRPKNGAVLKPGQYIGLKLDRIHDVEEIVLEGTGISPLTLETSVNGVEWSSQQKAAARYIRLMNKTEADVTFDLNNFTVETDEIVPMDLLETSMGNLSSTEDARSLGTTRYWMDQDLNTAAKYCATPQKDGYVTYSLGQDININAIKVYVLDTEIDYPRDAVIEVSADGTNWTSVLTIGDGVTNTGDADTQPVDNGWIHDTIDPAFAYLESRDLDVTARYLRMRFTADYNLRWVKLNEIRINDGAYFESINDPTFETTAKKEAGFEPQNLNDQNLTSAYRPNMEGTEKGSLIYHLSDTTKIGKINILQSGTTISNAVVSVRTEGSTWEELGTLNKSLNSFYTNMYENVLDIKLEWENVTPVIYEIIPLQNAGEDNLIEQLTGQVEEAKEEQSRAAAEVAAAEGEVRAAQTKVTNAQQKVAAATGLDKLKAEAELAKAKAETASAEAAAAAKAVTAAQKAEKAARLEAQLLTEKAKRTADAVEKEELASQAAQKLETAQGYVQEAANQQKLAEEKKSEETSFNQEAAAKEEEINNYQETPTPGPTPGPTPDPTPDPIPEPVSRTTYKNVIYKVVSSSAKTATVVAPKNKKVKSITIYGTVKIGNTTYKVTQISNKAFKACKKLTKVTIGKNIKKIGTEAFAQCTKLKNVNMKSSKGITTIGKRAFQKISVKATITVPKKKYSKYRKLLKSAGIPKTVKYKKA